MEVTRWKKEDRNIMVLDGEKEFKQQITSTGKSITSLKSLMTHLKEESKDQANMLDALHKKHSLLSDILDEHKKKEHQIADAFESLPVREVWIEIHT